MMAKSLMKSRMIYSKVYISKIFLSLFLFFSSVLISQSNIELNGYLQNMQSVWAPKLSEEIVLSNSMTNRINLVWYPTQDLVFRFGLRNIFDYGQFVSMIPYYSKIAARDGGYIDLTEEISSGNSFILYSNIDRLNLIFTYDKLEMQIGRQRINWGINSVWTPNDIFNSSSFINFDYVEKLDVLQATVENDYQKYFTLAQKEHTNIPNVRGMTGMDAISLLENLGLKVKVSGNGRVKSQSLNEGEKIEKGKQILLELSS